MDHSKLRKPDIAIHRYDDNTTNYQGTHRSIGKIEFEPSRSSYITSYLADSSVFISATAMTYMAYFTCILLANVFLTSLYIV